ncbi:glyoxal oxidase N-terminus-domain-containing protein [Entophlyctis helioformis]|nr:glyoxal oxidase N-terminus-domain-containing protein [Entophlyctis helioformis]
MRFNAAALTLTLAAAPIAVHAQPAATVQDVGVWTDAGSSGVVCIHTALLPNSKLLCFERPHITPYPMNENTNGANSAEIDLLNGASIDSFDTWTAKFTPIPIDSNPFCGGHAQMANGSILVFGGDNSVARRPDGTQYVNMGLRSRRMYDPCTGTNCTGAWKPLPDMSSERWYPSIVTLADGSNIIIGGSKKNLDFGKLNALVDNNPTYEYWPPKTGDWPRNLAILSWAYPYMLYPLTTLMPSGRLFLFLSNKTTILDPVTDNEFTTVPDMPVMDHAPWIYPHTPTFTVLPMTIKNNYAFKVQVCGGSLRNGQESSNLCWQINPDDANPAWVQADNIPIGHVMGDSVILPDGKILYVNGAGGGVAGGDQGEVYNAWDPVRIAMLYDPEAPANSQKPDTCMPYVKQFGPECRSPFNYRIERFEPPYLQKARRQGRPVIAEAPANLTHKSTFIVKMSTPADKVDRITFIRYTSTTHQLNTDQRLIELRILARGPSALVVEAPDVPGRAPPGNWMLFALDKDGVPSVAKTIRLQLGPPTYIKSGSGGSIPGPTAPASPVDLGAWTDAGSSGVVCIHTALLPNSKLLCFERPHVGAYPINPNTNGLNSAEIDMLNGVSVDSFDTWTSKFTPIGINSNPFCAGHASMANGSILVIGGDNTSMVGADGAQYIYNGRKGRRIFNPCTGTNCTGSWVNLPEMTSERWYPTIVTLADGSNIIIGGTTKNLDFNELKPLTDNNPTYDRVFIFVSNKTTILDPATDSEITTVPDMPVMDHMPWIYPNTATMTVLPMTIANNFAFKVQVCGGSKKSSLDASPMCWQINPDDANPTWVQAPDMPTGSVMVDSIILPDGKVLYVNGAGGGFAGGEQGETYNAWNPVRAAMLFNPEASANGTAWTSLAPATQIRLYHSGVVLTESGHVVTMGSEMDNYEDLRVKNLTTCMPYVKQFGPECRSPFNYRLERFEPPYLQKARRQGRPVIAEAPANLTHKSTFIVKMSTPADKVDRITFIRYTTTTHQLNTDQRFIELRILERGATSLVVQAPDVPGRAPPGNWMLFALDKDGVPSVAKTIRLQLGPATTIPSGSVGAPPSSANKNAGERSAIGAVASVLSSAFAFAMSFLVL